MQNLLWIQEDCSQRNNMWVEGIVETPQESWNDMEEKLHRFFREHFEIENIPLERAHQVDRKGRTKNEPRKIAASILDFKDKQKI